MTSNWSGWYKSDLRPLTTYIRPIACASSYKFWLANFVNSLILNLPSCTYIFTPFVIHASFTDLPWRRAVYPFEILELILGKFQWFTCHAMRPHQVVPWHCKIEIKTKSSSIPLYLHWSAAFQKVAGKIAESIVNNLLVKRQVSFILCFIIQLYSRSN